MDRFIEVLIALFLPPLAVALRKGLGLQFLINLVLCLLFWVPGIIHAVYVVCSDERQGAILGPVLRPASSERP